MRIAKLFYRLYILLKPQYGFNVVAIVYRMFGFIGEFFRYKSLHKNDKYQISIFDWYPCLTDKTENTPLDPVYFYQDTWAAGKIFQNKPSHHYDVGSSAKTIGIISQFVPTTMVDIRPVELQLKNLFFKQGSIIDLPFEDNSIESISSLCVVEHIGLGRYGDPLDQFGSEKAIKELQRVTKKDGFIYFSVPVESKNRVYFNGYRSFTKQLLEICFNECEFLEEKYIYGKNLINDHNPQNDAGIGLFMLRKK